MNQVEAPAWVDDPQQLLAAIVSSSDDAIVSKTLDGIITSWNAAAERMFGYTADQAIGQPITLIIPQERLGEETEILERIRAGQRVDHYETVRIAKDGRRLEMAVTISPLFDRTGRIVGASKVGRDITATKAAQRLLVGVHDETRGLDNPIEVLRRIATRVGRHYGVTRCAYAELDQDRATIEIRRGYTDGVPTVAGRHPLARFGPKLVDEVLAGRTVVVDDVETDALTIDPAARATYASMQIRSMVVAPIARGGRTLALLVIADRKPRSWARYEVELLEQVAQRTLFALETARVSTAVRSGEQVLSLAMRAGSMGVWTNDLATRNVWWSPELDAMFGFAPGGFNARGGTEQAFFDLLHPDDRPAVQAAVERALRERTDYRVDFRFRHAGGEWRWMEGRGQAEYDIDGHPLKLYGVGMDITERKYAEERLRRQAELLAETDRRKDEFLAVLAHELRNPLAPIRNAVQFMRLKGPQDPELQAANDIADRQVRQLVRLVDDLLDVSRISRGKLDLKKQRVALASIIDGAVEGARPIVEAGAHRLTVVLPGAAVELDADPARLAQVIQNLLNNAAKYTPPDGRIELKAEVVDGEAVISVTDNGIGIPPEMIDHVFDMFTQVDRSLPGGQEGLGVGLTLVQRLVQLHGGAVGAYSAGLGHGSTFTVQLPLPAPRPQVAATRSSASSTPTRALNVLVVDDNVDAAESLKMILAALGHTVSTEYDGRAGVDAALKLQPDVVLLDLGLPGLSGYEAAREIRAHETNGRTTMIAISGWGQEDDRRRSREAGFDDHLVKPADPDELRRLLSQAALSVARASAASIERG
jgi:PAS domain S-box-containing protein